MPETLHLGLWEQAAPTCGVWALPAAPSLPLSGASCKWLTFRISIYPVTSVSNPLLPRGSYQQREKQLPRCRPGFGSPWQEWGRNARLAFVCRLCWGWRGRMWGQEGSLQLTMCGSLPTSRPDPVLRTPEPQATAPPISDSKNQAFHNELYSFLTLLPVCRQYWPSWDHAPLSPWQFCLQSCHRLGSGHLILVDDLGKRCQSILCPQISENVNKLVPVIKQGKFSL